MATQLSQIMKVKVMKMVVMVMVKEMVMNEEMVVVKETQHQQMVEMHQLALSIQK